jgi:serine/threonine protein kinase
MAQVHRAVSARFPQPVALKRMLSHIASSEDMVKSFVREARLASYLRHENVAQTYDLGRVGEVYFIVMELITGRNLRAVLRHCGATTGPMPVPVALNILNQICDALDYAHNLRDENGQPLNIIHRDVSPSNVIVSDSGLVKLIDFGIAKASGAGMQTMSGTLKGKFAYMAPEYIAGRLDARADLFAVGVIAHELLTNRPLFSGRDDIDTLTRVRDMRIEPPSRKNPQVPPEIDDIVMTALARDPDRRWQHATALRSALTTLTQRLGLVASNAQVVHWLDWAFTHKRKPRPPVEPDTETDAGPMAEEPSISIEQCTVELPSSSQKATRVMRDAPPPEPPANPPAGTPAYLPVPRAAIPDPIGDSASRRNADRSERSGLGPKLTANGVAPTMARSSASYPVRLASPSAAPPMGAAGPPAPAPPAVRVPVPTHRSSPAPVHRAATAPVNRASTAPNHHAGPASATQRATAPVPGAPGGYAASHPQQPPVPPAAPSFPLTPVPGAPHSPALPAVPSFNPAPFSAPRPSTPSQPLPLVDPARSAVVMREFEQRTSTSMRTIAPTAAQQPRPMLVVVLVVLAAAIAAITVYFALPLLT